MKKIIKVLSGTVISLGMFNSTAYADTINYINYGSIVNNGVINNIDNSINNTNINYNVDERQFEGPQDEEDSIWGEENNYNYNKVYNTPSKNVNAPKKITIGQNVAYNSTTGTGWIKRDDGELIYFENNVQAINEWKEFPDGYRHFNEVGTMNHPGKYHLSSADWIWFNEDGTAKSESKDFEVYIPRCFEEPYDLDYIKHTLDVFNWQYDIEYKDTYDINEDGTIYKVETPHISSWYGREDEVEGSYTIYLYKYKDRGSFIK